MPFTRGGREGESAGGASQQSPEPGAGGGEEHAERHRADSEDGRGAEDPLPRPPLQKFQHPDDHRQRDAGRPEKRKSTLTGCLSTGSKFCSEAPSCGCRN